MARLADFPPDVIAIAEAKAKELENFDTAKGLDIHGGTKFKDGIIPYAFLEIAEDPDETEGKQIVEMILEDFAKQPINQMSNEELGAYINSLKETIQGTQNKYIAGLFV